MCGIAGILNVSGRPPAAAEVRAMCGALVHRGPDDEGVYVTPDVALGMRRLSIIDLATGSQPVRNEDGSIWVVFNGEIYNFVELRRALLARGHRFYTATDTETIVHLYEEYGTACVTRLRGMFAFALWDARRGRLLLARDRLGIKPLYYAQVDGRLLFASEVKALLALPEIDVRLDWGAVRHLFTFLTTPLTTSIVAGVRKLEAGHTLVASLDGRQRLERYWNLAFAPDHAHGEAYFVERLRERLDECVRLHMVSDVPLGAFLSGGIDSSAVVASMARQTGRPIKTFSIGFTEPDYDETPYARRVATALDTEHHELILQPDVLGILEDLTWHLDEPFGDSSAIPTYMVSKLAAAHVKVVLSGDGGDELFGGYDRYVVEARERGYRVPAAARAIFGLASRGMPRTQRGRNLLHHLSLGDPERYLDAITLLRLDEQRRLFRPEVFELLSDDDPWREPAAYLAGSSRSWLSAVQYLDFTRYLPLDILTKVDRMSMAHSIEARVPLLDHTLVELAATIPPELKLRDRTTKYIFKRALQGLLPDAILHRHKRGFAIPLGAWFRGGLAGFARELLLSETSRRRGVFDTRHIEDLLQRHARGRPLDLAIWTLISFEMWCRTFLDARATRVIPRETPSPATAERA